MPVCVHILCFMRVRVRLYGMVHVCTCTSVWYICVCVCMYGTGACTVIIRLVSHEERENGEYNSVIISPAQSLFLDV